MDMELTKRIELSADDTGADDAPTIKIRTPTEKYIIMDEDDVTVWEGTDLRDLARTVALVPVLLAALKRIVGEDRPDTPTFIKARIEELQGRITGHSGSDDSSIRSIVKEWGEEAARLEVILTKVNASLDGGTGTATSGAMVEALAAIAFATRTLED